MTTKKSMMKQMITVICSATLAACGNAPAVQTRSEYQVMDITTSDKELQTTYSAAIRGRQDIDIYPQVSGTLTRLCVEEGQAVRKGQILFIIDQVPYIAALRTAEANVEAAKAGVATSQLTYDSKRELYAQKVVSEFDLKTSHNSLLSAKAQLAQAEAQRINAANNLSYTEVKSPADGVVGTLPYRVGTLVSSGMPKPLTTVSDNSDMYVYFSMTENQMLELTRRYGSKDKALAEMPAVSLQLNDRSTYPQEGKIETISGVIDTSTGTVSLRAVFPNKDGLLTSGGSGNVIVPLKKEDCIVIPQAATYELQDKVFVYKVVDGKAQSAPVQVTRVNGGQEYIVENGLQVGDVIVVEGVGLLREGTPVVAKPASDNQQVKEG
ncbi:MAG TPA: efflux RND transporter periplasmic adaptor subunit [Bacteroides clarus]|jgi:membrane fusion protein (multidrug efflux system)|uniref:Efflux RND transporter periplasmic adaptor subunit n=1 Tax=Bacteroides clarus TaxID=626929 RepID=A0A1Y4K098_9BACE|nr:MULTISPECIES: efflux RND transporter periplasmic adaptor subunit [Bacteroides]OKZ02034.1 MAG: efflux transporter periplasmic adaptor subunit [Bacteroides sp. 44_46]OUP35711.1 efflux transporter periplasmic adaptor subunit [Bacteroides clarus]RGV40099.1 efflux RND transporter periplasmic adaptor subunit [Bacteroides clarus]RGV56816.1 efflux RND transporter periplasmic adaptor subunit [Bacteroides clarus]HJF98117.1 efflux RND transporter periplasmic adaptor subunit [Bacteroides clarus]